MSKRRSDSDLLPSISSSYRRLASLLERAGDVQGPAIGPLDTLLLTLYLEFRADRIAVVDFASGATRGASTLLASTRRTVRLVRVAWDVEGPAPGGWPAIEDALEDLEPGASCPVEPIVPGASGLVGPASRQAFELAIISAKGLVRSEFSDRIDEVKGIVRGGPVLVIGLGPTGRCPAVSELVSRSEGSEPPRLILFRELAGILGESGVGLLADDPDAELTTLNRISAFFSGNFDFLRMVEGVCRAAAISSQLDEPTRQRIMPGNSQGGIDLEQAIRLLSESNRERDVFRAEVDHLLEHVWTLQQEQQGLLRAIEEAADRSLPILPLPEPTLAIIPTPVPLPSLARRAARIWRRDGFGGLVRRVHHRARVAAGSRLKGGS